MIGAWGFLIGFATAAIYGGYLVHEDGLRSAAITMGIALTVASIVAIVLVGVSQ